MPAPGSRSRASLRRQRFRPRVHRRAARSTSAGSRLPHRHPRPGSASQLARRHRCRRRAAANHLPTRDNDGGATKVASRSDGPQVRRKSTTSSPSMALLPRSPSRKSFPARPPIWSSPSQPMSSLAPPSPFRTSAKTDPVASSTPTNVSVPCPVADPAVRSTTTLPGPSATRPHHRRRDHRSPGRRRGRRRHPGPGACRLRDVRPAGFRRWCR
jgi:hypothetical protein